ncbi:MAG: sterol carrier family protein [Propionibacteriaceae bacterium]|nr:sterol carrier family protein [Propionibacteriaceae bacterium]
MGIATQQRSAVRGLIDQGERLADFLGSLRPAEFHRAVPSEDLTVVAVVAQLLIEQNALLAALDQPTNQRATPLPLYCAGLSLQRHRSEQLAREIADHDAGPTLVAQFAQQQQEVINRLSGEDLPEVVAVSRSALRMTDLLRLMSVEWVLHADDISWALPGRRAIDLPRGHLADAVRLFTEILRHRHPGGSIEIRVPPFAAVQCGNPGEPRHTRGTPPNVVECQPLSFIRLCRGRETWSEAVTHNQLTASGLRADISEWFPLL